MTTTHPTTADDVRSWLDAGPIPLAEVVPDVDQLTAEAVRSTASAHSVGVMALDDDPARWTITPPPPQMKPTRLEAWPGRCAALVDALVAMAASAPARPDSTPAT